VFRTECPEKIQVFEEIKSNSFERECKEEVCTYEEMKECFPEETQRARETWNEYNDHCYNRNGHDYRCDASGTKLCIRRWNSHECICKKGFRKPQDLADPIAWVRNNLSSTSSNNENRLRSGLMNCIIDIDECQEHAEACEEYGIVGKTAQCKNTVGSYECHCVNGYENGEAGGSENKLCRDVDECGLEGNVCGSDENTVCENIEGSYNCNCLTGYERNTLGKCVDTNECFVDERICSRFENTICINYPGEYKCECTLGYKLENEVCSDIDECEKGVSETCGDENAICLNSIGSFRCPCQTGFEKNPFSGLCEDIDECAIGEADCSGSVNSRCKNIPGSFVCECLGGYSRKGSSSGCTDIDECLSPKKSCPNPNSSCLNTIGSFECPCVTGFESDGQWCKDIDECSFVDEKLACSCSKKYYKANCTNTLGSYSCANCELSLPDCAPGFERRKETDFHCENIDECKNGANCDSNKECIDMSGSHACISMAWGEQEKQAFCHHFYDSREKKCACFEGYEFCGQTYSCSPKTGYDKKYLFETILVDREDDVKCPEGTVQVNDMCYKYVDKKMEYASASEFCHEKYDGVLARVNDRQVWWVLGNKLPDTTHSFWVSGYSNPDLSKMIVVEEKTGTYELPNLSFKPRRYGISHSIPNIQEVAILNDFDQTSQLLGSKSPQHAYVVLGENFHNNATLWEKHANNYQRGKRSSGNGYVKRKRNKTDLVCLFPETIPPVWARVDSGDGRELPFYCEFEHSRGEEDGSGGEGEDLEGGEEV